MTSVAASGLGLCSAIHLCVETACKGSGETHSLAYLQASVTVCYHADHLAWACAFETHCLGPVVSLLFRDRARLTLAVSSLFRERARLPLAAKALQWIALALDC